VTLLSLHNKKNVYTFIFSTQHKNNKKNAIALIETYILRNNVQTLRSMFDNFHIASRLSTKFMCQCYRLYFALVFVLDQFNSSTEIVLYSCIWQIYPRSIFRSRPLYKANSSQEQGIGKAIP
jgi:hypothetical protein